MAGNVWEWTADWYRERDAMAHKACCVPSKPRGGAADQRYGPQVPEIKISRKVIGSQLCAPKILARYRAAARDPHLVDLATCHVVFRMASCDCQHVLPRRKSIVTIQPTEGYMKTLIYRIAVAMAMLGALAPAKTTNAQVEDLLKQGQQSGTAGSMGKLGGIGSAMSGGTLSAGSIGNVAGLLEFCIKNNFLKGKESSSVQDQLMGKLGGTPASDTDYAEGAQGLLKSGDGKQLDLSGSGLQAQASKQVCDQILTQAKSLL